MQSENSFADSGCRDDLQSGRKRGEHLKKDVLSIILEKMIKVQQIKKRQKPKANFYSVLTSRLQQQLKNAKNHSEPEFRSKIQMLQSCRNQRHTRHSADPNKQKVHSSTRVLLQRPTTSTPLKPKLIETPSLKCRNARHRKFASLAALLESKVDSIKQKCALQRTKSQQLKHQFKAAYFYQTLIDHNLNIIVNKIV